MRRKNNRRDFLRKTSIMSVAGLIGAGSLCGKASRPKTPVSKREAIHNVISGHSNSGYVPAGFFVHFGDGYRWDDAAVDRHLAYFNAIDMDFIKIQYEQEFPDLEMIKRPEDWSKMPLYGKDFYEKQLYVVRELVNKGKKLAPVIATLYSPFMCAGHSTSSQLLTEHMKTDPESVKKGLEIIAESVLIFAKECVKLGVDGFLASTQGGEGFRFQQPDIFNSYIKPFDLQVMNEIDAACDCNVLHICDYEGDYADLNLFIDYPGHIVNCSTILGEGMLTPSEIQSFFKRPFMGGMEKRGPITSGTEETLETTALAVLKAAPEQFILGAECALLGGVDWSHVRKVVDLAHGQS